MLTRTKCGEGGAGSKGRPCAGARVGRRRVGKAVLSHAVRRRDVCESRTYEPEWSLELGCPGGL